VKPVETPKAKRSALSEAERIRKVYAEREASGKQALYAWNTRDSLYTEFRKKETWARALSFAGISLADADVLDVGCGAGGWLRLLTEWGADPSRLHGVEILEDRIARARELCHPEVSLLAYEGHPLPHPDQSMDLVAASTVFSSIPAPNIRLALSREMERVARPGAWIMIFDFAVSSPRNPDTTGIRKGEIQRLFSDCGLKKTFCLSVPPPLLRRIPRKLQWTALAAETLFPFLTTHRIYVLKRNQEA